MGFHDFSFWVFTGNGGYLDASGVLGYAFSLGARQTEWFLLGHAVLVVLAALAWRHRREDTDLWLWTLSGLVAVLAGLRFFPHYYLQLLPPLCLLATRTLTSWQVFTRRWVLAAISLIVIGTTVYYLAEAFPRTNNRDATIASRRRSLRARPHRSEGSSACVGALPRGLLGVGPAPGDPFLDDGLPDWREWGTARGSGGHAVRDAGAWSQFLDDLRKHAPTLIVDMSEANQRNAHFYPPRKFPLFERYLESGHWRRVAVVDGAGIYRRSGT